MRYPPRRREAGPGRAAGSPAGEGDYTVEMVEKATPRHRRHAAPARRRGRVPRRLEAAAIIRKYSDHITLPILMKKEEWKDGEQVTNDEDETVNQASRAVDAPEVRHQRRAVQRVLQARRARLRGSAGLDPRPRRGQAGIHAAALHPGARAVRPVGPQRPPRHQALRAPRLHHGRRRAADAALPALRARRRRLERPAAQRLARDPAAEQGHRGIRGGCARKVLGAARGPGARSDKEKYAKFWKHLRPRAQGRRRRGPRQQGEDRRPAALRLDARRQRRADGLARRLRRPHEGRPGQDLLRHRRHLQRREEQPASRGLPQEGHRGAAAVRPRGRVGGRPPHRVRRQGAAVGGQGRSRPGQAGGRRREEGSEKDADEFKDLLEKSRRASASGSRTCASPTA